jgi:hypothetical protein
MECLDNIIGLSETTCPCFDDNKPSDYNESKSGIYLDQLDGFNIELAGAADDCARDGIWARMERAVRNAKFDYKNNLLGCIGTNFKPRIEPLSIQLGQSTFKGSANITNNYAGVKIMPLQIKGGVIIIKQIGVLVNASVPVTVKVFSNVHDNNTNSTLVFQSPPINATADTLTWATLSTPLELPMWSYSANIRYWVVYDLDGTYQPKNNKGGCGCAGVQKPYLRWMDIAGAKGDDANNPESFNSTEYFNGIVLDVQIKCKASEIICNSEKELDFEDDGYAMNIAYAIRFRAAAKLYEEILNTGVINRYMLLNREYVEAKIKEWNGEYMNWVNYLCANTNLSTNDCLVCRTTQTTLIKANINVVGQNYDWLYANSIKY